jgi:hypothetical protein
MRIKKNQWVKAYHPQLSDFIRGKMVFPRYGTKLMVPA